MSRPSRRSRGSVTVQDVAREAGVSAMTVSRVVNGGENVRASTRTAVLQAIEKLNYTPNTAARSLAAGEATQIGLLYSNPSAAYMSQFLIGALAAARRVGCHLVLEACESERADEQAEATRAFATTDVQGVLLPPPVSEAAPVLAELSAAGIPAVCVAVGVAGPGTLNVRIDDFGAAKAMTQHLLGHGHRRIGFIRGNPNQSASMERYRGFIAAIEEAGLHVPQDLSVVGFDDTQLATTVWPELTTIRQPTAAMAETALELLLAQLRLAPEERKFEDQVLEHELVIRESSGPVPAGEGSKAKGK
jgi:LacI family transcriptional regulator